MKQRLAFIALIAIFIAFGLLSTAEVWQGLTEDRIGFRNGGVSRAEMPILFWLRFGVESLFALVFWLAVAFCVVIAGLRFALRNRT